MSPEPDSRDGPERRALRVPGLFVLLVVLPLGLAGVSGDLIRTRHARSLAEDEARQMARVGLALAGERGAETALRILEGVVGYEAAFYRDGARELATDPGFGPASLEPGMERLEIEGRLGVRVEGSGLDLLTAASSPREPGPTYPWGRWIPAVLTLVVLLPGGVVLARVRAPGTMSLALVTVLPLALAWAFLVRAGVTATEDTERTSARQVGLVVAIARDLGAETPVDALSRSLGLLVARLENGRIAAASWKGPGPDAEVRGLPRPPAGRTITGYVTTSEERLRYAASRFDGGTTVFLAPAPELPPRTPALRLLLVGFAVTAAGAAFVFLARKP